jgi:hypothetical protein
MPRLLAKRNLGSAGIEQLRKHPEALAAFPILKNPPMLKRVRRCGGCSNTPLASSVRPDYEKIKRAIVAGTASQKTLVRRLLGAQIMTVTYVDENRRTKTVLL